MDAAPLLAEIARHLQRLHFDVVLIGNAAAALQGAPVTTVDFDFMFRKTPLNLRKLKSLAIRSKKAARRPRDLAVLDVLEKTDGEKKRAAQEARRPPARKRPRPR